MDPRSCVALIVGLLVAPAAWAQGVPEEDPNLLDEELDREAFEAAIAAAASSSDLLLDDEVPLTSAISFGAGALGVFGPDAHLGPALGPAATFRYTWMPKAPYAWELGWLGTPRVGEDTAGEMVILLETALKVTGVPEASWSPMASLGVGYGLFAGLERTDRATTTVPVSVGLEGVTQRVLVGLRATWRPTFFDQNGVRFSELGLDTWGISGDLGARF